MKRKLLLFVAIFIAIFTTFNAQIPTQNEIQKILASDSEREDEFGYSVSISGDIAIVGSPFNDDNGTDSGSAYIYELKNGSWEETAKLTASDADEYDLFGHSVSVSGTKAIIGVGISYAHCFCTSGAAYIFEFKNGTWSETAKLTGSDADDYDYFGLSVSISGDKAIVGAHFNEGNNGASSGSAFIFELINGTWIEKAKLTASDGVTSDQFGFSVSISGNKAIIGAQLDDNGNDLNSGSAYIFELINGTWVQQAKLTASDGTYDDRFGHSVYISGDRVIIESDVKNSGIDSGSAYLFELVNGTWTEIANLFSYEGNLNSNYDISISISGDKIVIGSNFDDGNELFTAGVAYLFELIDGNWTKTKRFKASDGGNDDRFGFAVSISSDNILVGAHLKNNNNFKSGSAYIFSTNSSDTTPPTITLSGENPQTITLGSTYTELGATANDNTDGDISANITIDASNVDTNIVGSYTVTYDVSDAANNDAVQVSRTVNVVDTTPPTVVTQNITVSLDSNGNATITPAQINDGSTDNYTTVGNLVLTLDNDSFSCSDVGPNTVSLTVTDEAGNAASGSATVTVQDNTAPIITLTGANPQTLELNTVYPELGVTSVTDNCDGNMDVNNVNIDTSALDNTTVGRYNVVYTITDSNGNTGTVTRVVHVMDTVPTAFDDAVTVSSNSTNNVIQILANDCFGTFGPSATIPLRFTDGKLITGTAELGTVSINDNGTPANALDDFIEYTPKQEFDGTDTFSYVITDVNGFASTAEVTVTVVDNGAVFVPTATSDTASVVGDTSDNIIDVLDNDSAGQDGYLDGGLTMTNGTLQGGTTEGGFVMVDSKSTADTSDDEIKYTPKAGFTGTDTFDYTITDVTGDASTATVTVTVTQPSPLGYAPDTATVDQDSTDNEIDVMANDSDDAGFGPTDTRFLIESVDHLTGTTAQGGTVTLNTKGTPNDTSDDVINYTPRAGFVGTDTFNYVPGNDRNALVQVTVTVEEVIVVDTTPSAVDDAVTVNQNSSLNTIDVLGNDDFGTDGANATHPLTFTNGSSSSASLEGGIITINDNGTAGDLSDDIILYTPPTDFNGTDSFDYVITDVDGDANTATVTITVNSSSSVSTPTAVDDAVTVNADSSDNIIDVLDNDSAGLDGYIDGGLTMTNGTLQAGTTEGGFVMIDNKATADTSDDEIKYTPKAGFTGTDTFDYTITDASGDASTATVTITVDVITDVPNATDDIASTTEDTSVDIDVLNNDSFGTDGAGFLTVTSATSENGLAAINVNGSTDVLNYTITYTPPTGFTGTDTITYTLEDANGDQDTAIVTVTVGAVVPVDTTPTAVDDSIVHTGNTTDNIIDVLFNDDFGANGPSLTHPLTFSNGTTTSGSLEGGLISIDDNGTPSDLSDDFVLYTPPTDFAGTDSFDYVITDADGDADTGTVTVIVVSSLSVSVPTAVDDAINYYGNTVDNLIDVLDNDSPGLDGYIDGGLTMTNGTLTSASTNGGAIRIDNKGTADTTDDVFLYSPQTGFVGVDTFQYTITDASGDASTATVTVNVLLPIPGVNDTQGKQTHQFGNITLTDDSFLAYPSPSNGNVSTMLYSTIKTDASIVLFDTSGKVVVRRPIEIEKGKNDLNFNFNVSAGVLFLKIISSEKDFGVQKIVFK